ncbi:peptide deformylase [Clostridia bacterium OttesenSCG-928-F22]|nr:peptide deformylase [Clostridia bacterium OttesenSCG-928-F22]
MAQREIITFPHPALKKKCKPVTVVNERVIQILEDLAETMYLAEGVGLAASQISVLRRLAVVDVGEGLIELINPEIIEQEGEEIDIEGCLSFPNMQAQVKRPQTIVVRTLTRDGKEIEFTASGYFARAICHETDHLDGVVYMDKAEAETLQDLSQPQNKQDTAGE